MAGLKTEPQVSFSAWFRKLLITLAPMPHPEVWDHKILEQNCTASTPLCAFPSVHLQCCRACFTLCSQVLSLSRGHLEHQHQRASSDNAPWTKTLQLARGVGSECLGVNLTVRSVMVSTQGSCWTSQVWMLSPLRAKAKCSHLPEPLSSIPRVPARWHSGSAGESNRAGCSSWGCPIR